MAHRFLYEALNGRISPSLVVRHTCDNPPCVRPDHLIVGTCADNTRDKIERGRDWNSTKTHCVNGHEFTPKNTRIYKGTRCCRRCSSIRQLQYQARRKLEAALS